MVDSPSMRRSARSSTLLKRKSTSANPIVIDDEDDNVSYSSTDIKSADLSRRTSGTVTPATSIGTLSEEKDEKTNAAEASKGAPTVRARRSLGKPSKQGVALPATPTKTDDIVDLTMSTQDTATVTPASSFGGRRRVSSRARKPTLKVEALPDKSDPKNKGKGKACATEEVDYGDFVVDSEDEADTIHRISSQAASLIAHASTQAILAAAGQSDSKAEPVEESELSEAIESAYEEDDDSEEEYTPRKRQRTRKGLFETLVSAEMAEAESSQAEEDSDEAVEGSSSSDDEDEDENEDVPLASTSRDPGSVQEDQQWETAKQRAKRLKREAREARADANARRTGRKRKKDKRTHYQKTKDALVKHHPELDNVWDKLRKEPKRAVEKATQPDGLTIKLLPFQLEGLNWLVKQEASDWGGGILADEMGMGKTIQIISLFLSDRKKPNLVVAPTVAILQWRNEIQKYTSGFNVTVWHGANRSVDAKNLEKADVVLTSYGVLESAFRKKVQGFRRKGMIIKEESVVHNINWHRVILDEAHNIKERATNTAKAAFELKTKYRWCLSGTPLQNRVGELYSMIRFLDGDPFSYYYCKRCPCKSLHWQFSDRRTCDKCGHTPMHHTCFWNNDILKPIQRYGTSTGEGRESFERLRLLLEHMMLRRTKIERADDMGLPPRTVEVRRDMFNEEEEDLYESLYSDTTRKFSTYLDQGTILNNYSNIFTLLTRMRQLACHPDLVLRSKTGITQKLLGDDMGSIHVCRICQDEAEDAIMSKCRHIFCRECVRQWIGDGEKEDGRVPECPYCHATLTIDLEADALESPRGHEEHMGARQGILSRLDMNKWRSSSKIEALVEELMQLRTEDKTIKSLVFSQFVNFLDLIAFRLTRAGFNICRLEGNMSPEARNKTIEHFMNNPGVTVFLVSLKAGGVALNLTEASRVFLMDPWWNPSVEVQAMDRIHRLGQHRPIIVKRMVIENSIESRIIELQNKKSAMIEAAIGKDDSAMGRLSVSDLSFLFSL